MSRTIKVAVAMVLVSLLCLPALADAGQFRFTQSKGVRPVTILTADEFEARFGDNPGMPRTDEAVVALARQLFRPHWARQYEVAQPGNLSDDGCREDVIGVLFAALANPAISDAARAEVDAAYAVSVPPLPKTYISGKFKILYTTSDANPDHNVTLSQVAVLASRLNSYYTQYVAGAFREPKHYHWSGSLARIDVKVYYLGAGLYGQTGSGWNHIELNSKQVVRDTLCKGRTTPAHELFHRVQYSYGYVSGTANMKWIVEGTASWSQRHTNWVIGDYMGRMNEGLLVPDLNLIATRSYNACHLWVFLQQRANATPYHYPIRRVWEIYATNGLNARAALNSYTTDRWGAAWNFDYFTAWWHRANIFKDFLNAGTTYDYSEDQRVATCGGVTYGPLAHVPRIFGAIATNSTPALTKTGSVQANGADYYEFSLGPGVTHVRVVADGQTGKTFTYFFVLAKSNRWVSYAPRVGTDFTYTSTFAAGARDKLQVIVVGNTGGSYSLRFSP